MKSFNLITPAKNAPWVFGHRLHDSSRVRPCGTAREQKKKEEQSTQITVRSPATTLPEKSSSLPRSSTARRS